jgi:catechol 2,3-dioxygenase-like lactoylglutathione lyase family enzyme
MKRFHVHVAVDQLEESIRFYSTLFGHPPSVVKPDYAKWMIEDPRINFAISQRDRKSGINHLGFQVESAEELAAMRSQLEAADTSLIDQAGIACCYARSDKHWVTDPSGIAWETFRTLSEVPMFGDEHRTSTPGACATPVVASASSGCCASK